MSDHRVPDVVFVVSKKRRTESKSASSTAQLATRGGNSFVDGRPLSWHVGQAISSDSPGLELPGLRPGAPGRFASGRGRVPESLSLEERRLAEEELMRDISAEDDR